MHRSRLLKPTVLIGALCLMTSACSSLKRPAIFETEVGYCRVASTYQPLRLSRKDTQKTIDDVGGGNYIYRCLCDPKWKERPVCKQSVERLKKAQ